MTTKNTRRDFTDEFKREAVSLLRGSGRPLTQVAAELGLQPSVLRRWRGPADEARSGATVNRPTAAVLASADQLEIRRLRKELERAQMERDILKTSLGRVSACGGRNWKQYVWPEGSGRQLFGGCDPVKKRGPWAVADLRMVTPFGDPG